MEKIVTTMECDYLVIGSGVTGMAFVDEIIHGSSSSSVILVDKRAKPGGHWVDAYPFVKLHQPSAFYGVNSKPLGNGKEDLVSKSQILAYYELVLEELKSTGQLRYFPQCEYVEEGKFISLLDDKMEYRVIVKKKTVDATLLLTNIPATKPPEFSISEGVNLIPINKLVDINTPWEKYVVIGAGKTGLDALLYLLDHDVNPDRIIWIVSNDCWYVNRDLLGDDLIHIGNVLPLCVNAVLESKDVIDVYRKLEDINVVMRVDKNVFPNRMRIATVSSEEMKKIRMVKTIVRNGRIDKIEKDTIIFKPRSNLVGPITYSTNVRYLHIDCSAAGTSFPPAKERIWDGSLIHLQILGSFHPTGAVGASASAALIAAIELRFQDDDDKKNSVCIPVDAPHDPVQWFETSYKANLNLEKLVYALGIRWMRTKRLSLMSHIGIVPCIKILFAMLWNKEKLNEKMKLLGTQREIYSEVATL